MVEVILHSEKLSTLFLIQRVTRIGRELFRESTHYFSFLDMSLENSQSWRAEDNRQGHESVPAKKPKVRGYMLPGVNSREHRCRQVRLTDMKQRGQELSGFI